MCCIGYYGWYIVQFEMSQGVVIIDEFMFVLNDMDGYGGLVVFVGGEFLCMCYWNCGIVWNDFFYQVIYGFQIE